MKKAIFIITVIILLLAIKDLSTSIYDIWHKKDFVSQAEKELEFQKKENQRLKSELSYSNTQEFVEKEARDKLFMAKEGEQKVIVPSEQNESSKDSLKEKENNTPNWKKWWNLFF